MVSGRRQAMDSAFIKANASMDSLLEKEVMEDVEKYADELNKHSEYTVTPEREKRVEQHHKYKVRQTKDIPGADGKHARFLSNHTHYSPADPDSRISTKPDKPRSLNYLGQLSVDASHHVITSSCADFSDKRDSQSLEKICERTLENLRENDLQPGGVLADTGYSSGSALQYLDSKGISAWIPNFGQFTPEREGFIYSQELNRYECQRGNRAILPFKAALADKNGYTRHSFRSSESICKNCECRTECCGEKTKFKRIEHSEHHDLYQQNHKKHMANKRYAQKMRRLRSATAEPVSGTLINFGDEKSEYTRHCTGKKARFNGIAVLQLEQTVEIQAKKARIAGNKHAKSSFCCGKTFYGDFQPLCDYFRTA